MLTKAVALSSIAALAGQAMAVNNNHHRHLHDKRSVYTAWTTTTVTETVIYYEGGTSEEITTIFPTVIASTTTPETTSTSSSVTSSSTQALPSTSTSTSSTKSTTLAASTSSSQPAVSSAPAPQPTTSQAPPAQPSTSKAAASPSPSPSSGSGGSVSSSNKKCMAYNDPSLANTFGENSNNMGRVYNWGQYSASSGLNSNYDFMSMLWSFTETFTNTWAATTEAAFAAGHFYVLSCNEPDNDGQSNLTPPQAAAGHIQFINPLKSKGAMIASPAVTNSQTPGEGAGWLASWIEECNSQGGCVFDFCATHYYGPADSGQDLLDHLESIYQTCNKPVFLTEVGITSGTDEDISNFLTTYLPKLEALAYLELYCYFYVATGYLMDSTTSLSSYGQTYASF